MPDKYTTFFSQPYSVDANGRFNSPLSNGSGTGSFVYTNSSINAAWYDTNATSNDGPAGVFRVVIDVDGVTGANTTGGFGSVYWDATGGSAGAGDIKVADMTFDVDHKYLDSGSTVVTGSFYVTD